MNNHKQGGAGFDAREALSHSTGSKIMAVVEAAKRMVKSGQAGEACSEIRAYYDLDEAVRTLEAKHE